MSLCAVSLSSSAQEMKPPAMVDTMAAKKMMMDDKMMMPAKKEMMGEKSMMPEMVAKEMTMMEMMHDNQVMATVQKATMAKAGDLKMTADKMKMAAEKMSQNESAVQKLFQEIVARYIAAKKMEMMAKAPAGGKMAMPDKAMMMDEKVMMESKNEMMMSESSPAMMARESLIQALMHDKDVMAIVEKEAKMQEEPAMAKMLSAENMMMKADAMAKDPAMAKGMMQGAMMRQMTADHGMMTREPAPKK